MAVSDYQFLFNGLLIGDGTVFEVLQADGLDSFDVRSNDQVLPSVWGVQPGSDFVNARTITLTVEMITGFGTSGAFETAFLPPSQASPATLSTFVWKFPDRPEMLCQCRVRRRARSRTVTSEIGVTQWVVQLDAPDPRRYSTAQTVTLITPYAADTTALDLTAGSGTGLAFDMTVSSGTGLAFDFTGISASGSVAVSNDGNVDTYPAFSFATTAAMSQWHVINDTTGETVSFAYVLIPGYTIVADMGAVATGSTATPVTNNGQSNYPIWLSPRVPLRMVPGTNVLRFFVDSGTAPGSTCTVTMRSAWL